MKLIDVSVPLGGSTPVWPGRPPVRLRRDQRPARGYDALVSDTEITMDAHAGTHLDTALHVAAGAAGGAEPDLSACIGPAHVVDARGEAVVTRAFLERLGAPPAPRILLRTHDGAPWDAGRFAASYTALDESAAEWLVEKGVRLVGIDCNSIQSPKASDRTHGVLLSAGVVVLEGLDLRHAAPGPYGLVCLPLRIPGCDGLPARAVLTDPGAIP